MRVFKKLFAVVLIVLILLTPLVVWQNHYAISDWWRLRSYSPPGEVVGLADRTALSGYGRRLFYVNTPQLDNKQTFNVDCSFPEATIVLGCFVSNKGIFVLNVEDPRLNGIEEVTSAHEMLHAAYDRLDKSEKDQVNGWLQDQLANIKDERIIKTLDGYRSRDPGVVDNEMHSIFGTEVRSLSPELEAYYKRYFDDRTRVVQYSEQYEHVFSDIKARVDAYDTQLTQLKSEIEIAQTNLDSEYDELQTEREDLNQLADADNIAAYNAHVPDFNNKVRQYNADLADLQAKIQRYNTIVTERNNVALEQRQLVRAIDSKALPQAP